MAPTPATPVADDETPTGASGATIGGAMMMVDVSVPLATSVPGTPEAFAVSANAVPTRNESHPLNAPIADVLDPWTGDEDGAETAGAGAGVVDAGAGVGVVDAGAGGAAGEGASVVVVVAVDVDEVIPPSADVVVVATAENCGVVLVAIGVEEAVDEGAAEIARGAPDCAEDVAIGIEEAVDDDASGAKEDVAPVDVEMSVDVGAATAAAPEASAVPPPAGTATTPFPTCQ